MLTHGIITSLKTINKLRIAATFNSYNNNLLNMQKHIKSIYKQDKLKELRKQKIILRAHGIV